MPPKQHEGRRLALVIAGQERSSQLDHRSESFEEVGAEFEQAARVEASVSKAGENLFRESQSIRPAQPLLAPVPEQQVLVVLVVFIKVEVFARSPPTGAVRLFTQCADVRHHTADFVMGGHGERQVSSLGNDLSLQAPLDLLLPVRRQRGTSMGGKGGGDFLRVRLQRNASKSQRARMTAFSSLASARASASFLRMGCPMAT